jgi:hypothetical protein
MYTHFVFIVCIANIRQNKPITTPTNLSTLNAELRIEV